MKCKAWPLSIVYGFTTQYYRRFVVGERWPYLCLLDERLLVPEIYKSKLILSNKEAKGISAVNVGNSKTAKKIADQVVNFFRCRNS